MDKMPREEIHTGPDRVRTISPEPEIIPVRTPGNVSLPMPPILFKANGSGHSKTIRATPYEESTLSEKKAVTSLGGGPTNLYTFRNVDFLNPLRCGLDNITLSPFVKSFHGAQLKLSGPSYVSPIFRSQRQRTQGKRPRVPA